MGLEMSFVGIDMSFRGSGDVILWVQRCHFLGPEMSFFGSRDVIFGSRNVIFFV